MGFGVIGAGRCYLHLQQHGSSCSGRTNIGEHLFLSCTSATHQLRFRADVFQIPQQRQALFVVRNPRATDKVLDRNKNIKLHNMAEVILMGKRTEHQHICSTYRSRTKPTAQTNAAIRAANVTVLNNPNRVFNFQQAINKSETKYFCFAKATMPTHHPKQMNFT